MDFVRMSDPWTLLMRVTETLDNLFFYASRNCLSHLQKHAKQCIHISHCPTSYRCILFVVKRFAFMSNKTDTRSFRMVDQGWWEKDTERERKRKRKGEKKIDGHQYDHYSVSSHLLCFEYDGHKRSIIIIIIRLEYIYLLDDFLDVIHWCSS